MARRAQPNATCGTCGLRFYSPPYRFALGEGKYCSKDCAGVPRRVERWFSDPNYRGRNWITQRHRARKRDGYSCRLCGKTRSELGQSPDVHHVIAYRLFRDDHLANSLKNLICLCRSCHIRVERGSLSL